MQPLQEVRLNTPAFLSEAMIAPTGFREYDARWRYPEQINLPGMSAVGLGLATQLHEIGCVPRVVVACDYRSYSLAVKQALTLGLVQGGAEVLDIGVGITPMAYFAQFHLDAPAVAMVTASHNPNGWTGVKIGAERPLTHGPAEMERLREIVLNGAGLARPGGSWRAEPRIREAYLDDLAAGDPVSRSLKVVCACGNGGAGIVAPDLLRRLGVDVVDLHCRPDYNFPHYNPNPESLEMLHDMGRAVKETGADLALGFDGDGDRCGVVDETGTEIFADKVGVILARDWIGHYPGATFVADVKSTGLFATDPALADARIAYWKTGHSHMKRRVHELGALAGFEKSGHYFFAPPIGRGFDDGMRVAVEICRLLDRNSDQTMSSLCRALPETWSTPTMSPFCPDAEKYGVAERLTARLVAMAGAGERLAGLPIEGVVTVNGARVMLKGGAWALVRASSNTPNLVVVCESPHSEAELRTVFEALDAIMRVEPSVGAYDQTF